MTGASHVDRTYLVTGGASGIGAATTDHLRRAGGRVLTVDLRDADLVVDLSTAEGRAELVAETARAAHGRIDGVVACAGVGSEDANAVAVNYFGMVATLAGLNPLLATSAAPRAVGIASMAAIHPVDGRLLEMLLAADEARAMTRASRLERDPSRAGLIYGTTKRAFARWIRRVAPLREWAGNGIPLNAISPGIVMTPMVERLLDNEKWRSSLATGAPSPLNGMMEPRVPASLLAWLVSPENSHLCGQVIYLDSGADAVLRGDARW
jgi:NAD(P)-dependent dehydrogenase (short-subunit alcohol dehydrogenase family)